MKKLLRIALWTMAAFLFLVMIAPYVLAGGLRVVWTVLFGWLEFLKRVIPAVTVSWSGVAMVVICSALIVGGLHWLCAWFARQRSAGQGGTGPWRPGWSLALYGFLWLLFIAAMCITGFTHQVTWLARSQEPWRTPRKHISSQTADLKQAAMAFAVAAEDEDWNLQRTRRRFLADEWIVQSRHATLLEDLHFITVPDAVGNIVLAALSYRDPALRERIGAFVLRPQSQAAYDAVAYTNLPSVIATAVKAGGTSP